MEQEIRLSVIVPVYNVERYLERCVASLLDQPGTNLEVILVDDGSTDGSEALCNQIAAGDSRVRVIHKKNGGLSSARNMGLEQAVGDYITFVDSDDWVEPGCYAQALELLEESGAQMLCGGRYDVNADTGEKKLGLCPTETKCISGKELAGKIFLWDHCDSSACDKIYRRQLFETLRYPEGMICEDVPVIYRVGLLAEKVLMWNHPYYCYFHRPGSITNRAVSEKTFHFSQHARQIYQDIREHHPDIEPQAHYLLVRALSHLLLMLIQSGPETRRRYASQIRETRRELRTHTGFFLTYGWFSTKERVRNLLLAMGIYDRITQQKHKE